MKNLLILLFTLFITQVIGQKIKNETLTYPYLSMAKGPIQANFETYSVKIISKGYALEKYGWTTKELVDEYFKLDRYEYVNSRGDLEMTIEFGDVPAASSKVVKNKKGNYDAMVTYGLPIKLKFKDGKRDLISERIFNTGTKVETVVAKTYGNNYKKANASWKNDRAKYITEILAKAYVFEFKKLRLSLASIDNRLTTERRTMFYIKDAEKYGFNFTKDDLKAFKSKYKDISKNMDIDAAKSNSKMILDKMKPYLNDDIAEVKFVALYNSAYSSVILEEYEEANNFIQSSMKLDMENKKVEKLKEEIEDRMNRLKVNDIKQEQYVSKYDNTGVVESETLDYVTGETMELRDYVIDKKGNRIHGVLHVSGLLGGVVDRIDIDTKKEDQERMTRIKSEDISEIGFDGKVYITKKFKDPGNLRSRNYCLLKVYENKNVVLVKKETKDLNSKNANYSPYYIIENFTINFDTLTSYICKIFGLNCYLEYIYIII